ncbi:MAG: pectate lyase [Sphingosinicella sp.]|uniref:pectate lyase n=1 Tax=Sphingosinicella sp. TaxID=1917971 RepID=UPI0040382396
MIARLLAALALFFLAAPAAAQSDDEIRHTMRRATEFMVERVAVNGGYVWAQLPDGSRRWGEIEAYPSMIWVQPPGTATMGHLFLDAYHATGDEYYYQAADRAARALVAGQHRSGGWHYFIDFAGPASTRRWYETIGRNAWRMEEFHHYGDNATFDDAGTAESMQLLLRIYLEKRDEFYRAPLDRAISFVIDSQYPNGGWPQRWPPSDEWPDYADLITFNDDVAQKNIRFLLMVYRSLGVERVIPTIRRAMEVFPATQQPMPQPGWSLQHNLDLTPSGARSYEPLSLATHTTASNLRMMLNFYRMTADSSFIARVPETLDWLESLRLPPDPARRGRDFPTFIEIGTNRPIYIHRRGSNVVNGRYYWDYNPEAPLGHYGAWRAIDIPALRREYEELRATPRERLLAQSPLRAPANEPLPRYFVINLETGSDLNASAAATAAEAIASLNEEGWWPTPLRATSNPYRGPGPRHPPPGDFRTTHVGDASDTSPYPTDNPVIGISTATYMANMALLLRALERD